jgi:hypothetical protein
MFIKTKSKTEEKWRANVCTYPRRRPRLTACAAAAAAPDLLSSKLVSNDSDVFWVATRAMAGRTGPFTELNAWPKDLPFCCWEPGSTGHKSGFITTQTQACMRAHVWVSAYLVKGDGACVGVEADARSIALREALVGT